MSWHLYMIRCRDHSLYTGITTDVEGRFEQHQSQGARCAKYLRGKGPLTLAFSQAVGDRSAASRAEYYVKLLTKAEKEALVAGECLLGELLG